MHKLVISDDEGKTTIVPLIRDEITIGRKEGNTIRLTERNVSRRHARLVRANGSFQIEDLGSYNGIRLNGVRISDKSLLKEGDQVQIGDYQLALQSDKAAARAAEEQATAAATTPLATAALTDAPTEVMEVQDATLPMPVPPTGRTPQNARLVLLSAPSPGQEFALNRDECVIGRAEECDVSINHRSLSREHAKILRVDQAYRILDLESANGVRVNGQDVPYVELRRGDLIELGHVRLRFIAPGETYRFDGDATVQMSTEMGRQNRTPLWVLAAALLVTGGVALYMSMRPEEPSMAPDRPTAEPASHPSTPPPPPATPTPTPAPHDVSALLRDARSARDSGDLEGALQLAAQAKSQEPTNTEAQSLLEELQREQQARSQLTKGKALLPDDYRGAFAAFESIPRGTEAARDPDVVEAARHTMQDKLDEARRLLRTHSVDDARRLATEVRDNPWVADAEPGPLASLAQEAQSLLRSIDEHPVTPPAPPTPPTHQPPHPPPPGQTAQNTQPPPVPTPPPPTQATNQRDCFPITTPDRGRCYIQATGGVASGEFGLRNLILAYKAIGDRGRVRNLGQQYLDHFPDSPFARQIRQLISQ
jgi:pSer/pThr/pTyr-binding forkhead associated (FHA) protein